MPHNIMTGIIGRVHLVVMMTGIIGRVDFVVMVLSLVCSCYSED